MIEYPDDIAPDVVDMAIETYEAEGPSHAACSKCRAILPVDQVEFHESMCGGGA